MSNPSSQIDLGQLFQTVTGTLARNKVSLNEADTNNHDHGDNMVSAFEMITRAIKEKQGAAPAEQLAYAAETLSQQKSGSAQLYARGLSQASQQFQGQQVTADNAGALIQTLLGGGGQPTVQQPAPSYLMVYPANGEYITGNSINFVWNASPGATRYWLIVRRAKDGSGRINKDMGNALSSSEPGFPNDGAEYKWTVGVGDDPDLEAAAYFNFSCGTSAKPQQQVPQQQQQQQQDPGIGDIIGTLIRKQQGQGQQQQQQPGGGVGDIIGSFIRKQQGQGQQQQQQPGAGVGDIIGLLIRQQQAKGKQQSKGGGDQEAIVNNLVSGSPMAGSYRSQSGSLVADTLITAIQNMVNKK